MVGIVIVSHSSKVAEGIKELAGQMAQSVPMVAAGGTSDGRLGTDVQKIMNAIQEVYSEDGVVVLFDLGSAYMNSEMAIECLPEDMQKNIAIVDTALVEGAVTAAVESSLNSSLEAVKKSVAEMSLGKMP
ncbi:dihydroxyacetone kinase phosphoryl donor subunit DhaM [Clostridium sp. MB40-C1]|uniref:dihydroxyacetone kinase phosphoryl donor subunit DhaM n=1 Tax=Clostridium sp. MB40-C1 TaxID=3070996 RepID=UPI0027DEABF9|nr:dihydroxyacetone kinase phosphoryl donor subunit DhaM [Clostridium sp. MB40-C1]WMJ79204.1 dihydroxyacetone kinase phosphoryl donor subunit DhaM [Clostridium sp. MB40-C1]